MVDNSFIHIFVLAVQTIKQRCKLFCKGILIIVISILLIWAIIYGRSVWYCDGMFPKYVIFYLNVDYENMNCNVYIRMYSSCKHSCIMEMDVKITQVSITIV